MSRKPLRPPPPPEGCLWIDEAADRIGVTKSTLYKWRQKEIGPRGFPVARRIAYRIEALDAHLAACESAGAATEPDPESRPPEPRRHRAERPRKTLTAVR